MTADKYQPHTCPLEERVKGLQTSALRAIHSLCFGQMDRIFNRPGEARHADIAICGRKCVYCFTSNYLSALLLFLANITPVYNAI
jgi:4-hydroxy-3-methylbut-2-en-1-yl diphosphate synthase IspG/GcpE